MTILFFSNFELYNSKSKKTYKVAIRSLEIGENFCTCPDFKINTLGTCKHIEYVLHQLQQEYKNHPENFKVPGRSYSSIYLKYGEKRQIKLRVGTLNANIIHTEAKNYFDINNVLQEEAFEHINEFMEKINYLDPNFKCYPDAMAHIIKLRSSHYRKEHLKNIFDRETENKIFDKLLKTQLYPYQKEGIKFAALAGRSLIADEMGLGKTIQAIGTTELLAREMGVEQVLIIAPTSLKYQWKYEIEKFTEREVNVIEGPRNKRKHQYNQPKFFNIISYNTVLYDLDLLEKFAPDLVILDEAQRIKNWKAKTSQCVKAIESEYCIALTGTPLENRIEELHSIVEFIDETLLGPLFQYLHDHQITDDSGKVIGYQDLHDVNKSISQILVRRTKKSVSLQLPERVDKNFFVPMTKEQETMHADYSNQLARLLSKWKRLGFLPEADRQRLLMALNCMRMVADSTYILDQETRFDVKISELLTLLGEIMEQEETKVVIFSSWERMTRLVAWELEERNIPFKYLHGGVPSHKRKDLINDFREDSECKIFLSTDAGGVGLNLQSASFLINLDIPWNPAILEQRIARVHRLGQQSTVNVINFISQGSIEMNLLKTLAFKSSVFSGVLDLGENNVFMGKDKFKKFMESVEKITIIPPQNELEEEIELEDMSGLEPNKDNQEIEDQYRLEKIRNENFEGEAFEEINELDYLTDKTELKVSQDKIDSKTQSRPETRDQRQKVNSSDVKVNQTETVSELLSNGISFLQNFSAIMKDHKSTKSFVSSLTQKDEKTGQKILKLPVNEEIVDKVASVLDNLFKGIT